MGDAAVTRRRERAGMRRPVPLRTTAAVLALAVFALTGCGSDGNGDAGPSPSRPPTTEASTTTVATNPTTTSPPTTAGPRTTTTAPAGERLSPSSRLRVDGIGPVRVGMSLDQARAAAGIPLELVRTEHCQSLRPSAASPFVTLIATAGDAVDVVTVGPQVATVSGIRIGSTEQQVLAAYGDRAQVVNPGEPLHRIVYRAADPSLQRYALVFEISDGKVASMRAGTDAVLADEICA